MIIKDDLIKPYEIHLDGNSYTVGKVKENSKGEAVFNAEKYFMNFPSALHFITRSKLIEANTELTLKQYVEQFNAGIQRLKGAFHF